MTENQNQTTAHDDFDWDIDNHEIHQLTGEENDPMDKMYEDSLVSLSDAELIEGKVAGITDTDVIINIGYKSDGLISLNEFRDLPDLQVGDQVEVMIVETEDEDGNLLLSRKKARQEKAWNKILDAYKTGEIINGNIVAKTKGGLIVDIYGLETFLPGSQIDVNPITDYDQYIGKSMEFKVVKVNEAIRNAVVSHKALIESDMEEQRAKIMETIEVGQVLEGVVKNVTDFGAFIDLGGIDGLLYITDISWGRVTHPSEVLENGQKVKVAVLDYDDEKKRISLGLKQLTPHPWENIEERIKVGDKVKGKVVNIEDYGAFLEIEPGVEGLIHVSELSWSSQPINSKDFFKVDQEYEAAVVSLNPEERKMSLSIKQLTEDPWDVIETKYPVDSVHNGTVKNLTPYGVFVELEPGIGGMIHISDLSWTKRFNHPSEFVKSEQEIQIKVLNIDKENRKLSLGHKQLEEDPWINFATVFTIGSMHPGTIIKKEDKGSIVELEYGLQAYAPGRHLRKEDGTNANVDERLEFMVIEFDANEKRIMVSHTNTWEGDAEENMKKEQAKAQKQMKSIQSKVEKSTLGDVGGNVLDDIKKKLDSGDSQTLDETAEDTIKTQSEENPDADNITVTETQESSVSTTEEIDIVEEDNKTDETSTDEEE